MWTGTKIKGKHKFITTHGWSFNWMNCITLAFVTSITPSENVTYVLISYAKFHKIFQFHKFESCCCGSFKLLP